MTKLKKILTLVAGIMMCIPHSTPVYADTLLPATDTVRIYEIDMNDQTPMDTLKKLVIEERSTYDAAVNLSMIDMEESSIFTNAFDRTKPGIQNITISVALVRNDDTSAVGYDFVQNAAVKMIKPEGPQVILKQPEITVDLDSTFNYADNIGYISNIDGKLPVIKEEDNVDLSTEGTYTCHMEFIDSQGKHSLISYDVIVQKPAEVIRAEEEAAAAAEAARIAQEALEQAQRAAQAASTTVNSFSYAGSGSTIVEFAQSLIGSAYVWGGSSPSTGFDCSGFTQYVYGHFGVYLPHSSYSQETYGTVISPSEAQPGDLVTYDGHAAIYVGNGMIVHAMDPSNGVRQTSMYAVSNGNMQVHRLD